MDIEKALRKGFKLSLEYKSTVLVYSYMSADFEKKFSAILEDEFVGNDDEIIVKYCNGQVVTD